jgi:hypothetical protein
VTIYSVAGNVQLEKAIIKDDALVQRNFLPLERNPAAVYLASLSDSGRRA